MNKTLALIFAALGLMIGSFIWFVATWDASREAPISSYQTPSHRFILANKLPPEGPLAAGVFLTAKATI